MRIAIGAFLVGLVLAGCGGSSSPEWKDLRTVTLTVAQPGLPPPFSRPKTSAFSTAADVARVTTLLNSHHIAKASNPSANPGCAGGFTIAIVIVRRGSAPVRLSAYRCANQTSGDVSGDLVGFLQAIGVKT